MWNINLLFEIERIKQESILNDFYIENNYRKGVFPRFEYCQLYANSSQLPLTEVADKIISESQYSNWTYSLCEKQFQQRSWGMQFLDDSEVCKMTLDLKVDKKFCLDLVIFPVAYPHYRTKL